MVDSAERIGDLCAHALWECAPPSAASCTLVLADDELLQSAALRDEPDENHHKWQYKINAIEDERAEGPAESSSLLRQAGARRDFILGSRSQRPFKPAGEQSAERHDASGHHVQSQRNRIAMAQNRLETLAHPGHLEAELASQKLIDFNWTQKQIDVFDLGSVNAAQSIERFVPSKEDAQRMQDARAQVASDAGHVYIIDEHSSAGISLSVQQEGFRLDSVFQRGDEELFGGAGMEELDDSVAEGSEDDHGGDEDGQEALGAALPGANELEDMDALNAELDALLASEPSAVAKAERQLQSKKGRSRAGVSEQWAVEEHSDVSDFAKLVPEPAITYPFDLDQFQKRAILHLERGESVFVAAHTSAGKTVVAEYAIALARQHRTRVIYTSPIKTLSNQKFREFSRVFGDVGIVTGDVSLQPEAECLVMTTEILRSMLYKGADIIRDVEWVIFDEVHYVNDVERGVVWEEVIIMLPESIGLIMLSATVPNVMDFAEWVGRSRRLRVFVTGTTRRPVPLEHSILVKKERFLIMDSRNQFIAKDCSAAKKADELAHPKAGSGPSRHHWGVLLQYLKKTELVPAVVFAFSKRRCESAASSLQQVDLSDGARDKASVHSFFDQALARLQPTDRTLPQVIRVREMLKRGIGVHHAGLLPIVKEVTEILFQRGLVRVLFATETFAMGVNMPARAVVFSSLSKFDGQKFRQLTPGEYTQMAGRAGRRGLDSVGHVLLCFEPGKMPSALELSSIMTLSPPPLLSKFRLSYNMILNLLRVDSLRVEDIIRRSFAEAGAKRDGRRLRRLISGGSATLSELREELPALRPFEAYYELVQEIRTLSSAISAAVYDQGSRGGGDAIVAGRVLFLWREGGASVCLGVALKAPARVATTLSSLRRRPVVRTLCFLGGAATSAPSPFFDAPLSPERGEEESKPDDEAGHGEEQIGTLDGLRYVIRSVPVEDVLSVRAGALDVRVGALAPPRGGAPQSSALSSALQQLRALAEGYAPPLRAFAGGAVDARRELRVDDAHVFDAWRRREQLLDELLSQPVASSPRVVRAVQQLGRMRSLEHKLQTLRWAESDESLQLLPDYHLRLRVLRRLAYVAADDDVVQLKGRAACEVNTCDSLVLTEVVFESVLRDLDAAHCAALLTALVNQERASDDDERGGGGAATSGGPCIQLPAELRAMMARTEAIVSALGAVQAECGLPVASTDYVRATLRWSMSELVLHWAQGESFAEVLPFAADVPEGSVVRCVVRLSELLREMRNVARVIGDVALFAKMEHALELIKRDIIFSASLYIS